MVESVFCKQYFCIVRYIGALVEVFNVKLLMNWCVKMEQILWQKEEKIAEYKAVKSEVAKFMDSLEECEGYKVIYNK